MVLRTCAPTGQLHFQEATFLLSAKGIQVTIDQDKSLQVKVFLQAELFDEYRYSMSYTMRGYRWHSPAPRTPRMPRACGWCAGVRGVADGCLSGGLSQDDADQCSYRCRTD